MKKQKIVALIPARGGSKEIKRKNIIDLDGYPLIAHSILMLKSSGIEDVWVSTDDKFIADIATRYGARVLKRPGKLSTAVASTESVISHFLSNVSCDIVILVQCTSPLTSSDSLCNGLDKFLSNEYDSLFSVVKSNDTLIWNSKLIPLNYDPKNRKNRQTRKDYILIETGAFVIFTKKMFLQENCRIGGKIGFAKTSFWESFQIDTKEDLRYIRKLIRK